MCAQAFGLPTNSAEEAKKRTLIRAFVLGSVLAGFGLTESLLRADIKEDLLVQVLGRFDDVDNQGYFVSDGNLVYGLFGFDGTNQTFEILVYDVETRNLSTVAGPSTDFAFIDFGDVSRNQFVYQSYFPDRIELHNYQVGTATDTVLDTTTRDKPFSSHSYFLSDSHLAYTIGRFSTNPEMHDRDLGSPSDRLVASGPRTFFGFWDPARTQFHYTTGSNPVELRLYDVATGQDQLVNSIAGAVPRVLGQRFFLSGTVLIYTASDFGNFRRMRRFDIGTGNDTLIAEDDRVQLQSFNEERTKFIYFVSEPLVEAHHYDVATGQDTLIGGFPRGWFLDSKRLVFSPSVSGRELRVLNLEDLTDAPIVTVGSNESINPSRADSNRRQVIYERRLSDGTRAFNTYDFASGADTLIVRRDINDTGTPLGYFDNDTKIVYPLRGNNRGESVHVFDIASGTDTTVASVDTAAGERLDLSFRRTDRGFTYTSQFADRAELHHYDVPAARDTLIATAPAGLTPSVLEFLASDTHILYELRNSSVQQWHVYNLATDTDEQLATAAANESLRLGEDTSENPVISSDGTKFVYEKRLSDFSKELHTVTVVPVLTPEEQLTTTNDALLDIVNGNPGTPLADKIQDVSDKVQTALDELAKIPPDNQAAMGNIEGAVGDLEAAVNDGLLGIAQGTQLLDELAAVARQMAAVALADAIDRGGDPGDIADAQQAFDEGDTLRAVGAFKDAVNKYKDTLAKAEGA